MAALVSSYGFFVPYHYHPHTASRGNRRVVNNGWYLILLDLRVNTDIWILGGSHSPSGAPVNRTHIYPISSKGFCMNTSKRFFLKTRSPMFEPASLSATTFSLKRQSWQTGYSYDYRVDSDVLPGHPLESARSPSTMGQFHFDMIGRISNDVSKT